MSNENNGQDKFTAGAGEAPGRSHSVDAGRRITGGVADRANTEGQAGGVVGILKEPPKTDTCEVLGSDPAQYKVTFTYKSWRGIVSARRVLPIGIMFGSNEWHPKPQWLLYALDFDKNETRYFAVQDISDWKSVC